MSAPILDYFPLPKIRPAQKDALLEIFEAFKSGHKFVILEGPPGVGKSAIAVALARYYRSAYVLTVTKQLQDQYRRDFNDARVLKGRASFTCHKRAFKNGQLVNLDCDSGNDEKHPCDAHSCPYRVAKATAVKAKITVCNYLSYLWSVGTTTWNSAALIDPMKSPENDSNWFSPLLILDEGHEAEQVMLDFTSVTIDAAKLPFVVEAPLPRATDEKACFAWLEQFLIEAEGKSFAEEADAKALDRLREKAVFALDYRDAETWISEPLDKNRQGFALKPLTVKSFCHRLFKYGTRVLLMSATILDAEKLASSLGIKDYVFVSTPCPFPVENRPVIVSGLNMTKAYRDRSWPAMIDQVTAIMEAHETEKGLILTPSNEMLDYLMANLPRAQSQRFIIARGKQRLVDYQRHLDSTGPSVLAASGYWEGADLKDDFSRFQILPAVPRPFWGGQIAARGHIDKVWYRMKTYQQLIQGVGRSVRSETDSAVTYVLDGALRTEAERSDTMLPLWFREALVYA